MSHSRIQLDSSELATLQLIRSGNAFANPVGQIIRSILVTIDKIIPSDVWVGDSAYLIPSNPINQVDSTEVDSIEARLIAIKDDLETFLDHTDIISGKKLKVLSGKANVISRLGVAISYQDYLDIFDSAVPTDALEQMFGSLFVSRSPLNLVNTLLLRFLQDLRNENTSSGNPQRVLDKVNDALDKLDAIDMLGLITTDNNFYSTAIEDLAILAIAMFLHTDIIQDIPKHRDFVVNYLASDELKKLI